MTVPGSLGMIEEFNDRQHRAHCKIAGCRHPAVHPGLSQGWCARCRAVAFRGMTRTEVDAEFGDTGTARAS